MTLRSTLSLTIAVLAAAGCSDSTEPTETVPRQLYYFASSPSSYPYTSGYTRLYGAALDGSSPISVIPDSILARYPIWSYFPPWVSPDGTQIKVIIIRWSALDYRATILTVDPFGAVLSEIPFPDSVPTSPRPTFSPDGTRLAWYTPGFLNISTLDGVIQKINFDSLGSSSGEVAWSRDGGSVAFATWHHLQIDPATPTDVRLWVRRLSDGFTRPLPLHGAVSAPAWSRDGKWLTVTAGGSIHRRRADGTGSEQVLYDGGVVGASSSAWGPGDSLLAIAAGSGIVLIHPDGGGAWTMPVGSYQQHVAWRD